MEPLSRDDPRRIGPYHLIARLDPEAGDVAAVARCFIARSGGGDRTVLISAPPVASSDDAGYPARFRAEAENARLLSGASRCPWIAPVVEVSGDGTDLPWSASPYLPTLPLPAALEAYGGPLPVRTVRAVGAALAEALHQTHAAGFTHAGIAPATVFLAGDGPRLTGFGAVRAAGPDGTARAGLPGLDADALPPEQLAGGRPRPLGDVFALGAVLAYAATGRTRPEADALPQDLRDTLRACLAPDPADRPTARTLLDDLLRGAGAPLPAPSAARALPVVDGASGSPRTPGGGPGATALDAGISRAVSVLGPGWLPARLVVALAEQSASVLAAEIDAVATQNEAAETAFPREGAAPGSTNHAAMPERTTVGRRGTGGAAHPPGHVPGRSDTAEDTGARDTARPSRRSLLIGTACGAAGIAAGGAVAGAVTAGDAPAPRTPAERLMAAHRSRRRLAGAPPTPLWRFDTEGGPLAYDPLICADQTTVIATDEGVTGLDLRTGKRLWTRDDVRARARPRLVGKDLVLIPGTGIAALAPRTGDTEWQPAEFRSGGRTPYAALLAVDGGTIWIAAERRRKGGIDSRVLIAFDVTRREGLWTSPLPGAFDLGYLTKDVLVVRGERFMAFDRTHGARRWTRSYKGVTAGRPVTTDGGGTLIASVNSDLCGYDLARGGGPSWTVPAKGHISSGHPADFGPPVIHGDTVYATDGGYAVHALSVDTGDVRWQRVYGFVMKALSGARTPDTRVSPSGHTVLMSSDVEVDAIDAEDGTLRWRFTDSGATEATRTVTRRRVALTDDLAVVVSGKSVYGLPLR
ncbi:PQQ-binding-like beta-propeller repeat protein [Streptomyces sp. NPDC019937]|uniref:outer membrane protein assembly factor BamB family protein n=1 Tax=Streptomyces sp. NPDC019937 TaxID=3154787 RepID=UPI003410A2AF